MFRYRVFLLCYLCILGCLLSISSPSLLYANQQIRYSKTPSIAQSIPTYSFAVHPLHNPKRLFSEYKILIDFLNENLKAFQICLVASRDYNSFEQRLNNGSFEFALANPLQAIKSLPYNYKIIGKFGDDENFRGLIITRKNSNFITASDLQGLPIAFPAPTALAATIMPLLYLHENGLDIENMPIQYVGSQESAIMSVYLGESVAAGTWPLPWEKLIAMRPEVAKVLQVQWQTPSLVNNAFIVRKDVPKEHVQSLLSLLVNLNTTVAGRQILHRSGNDSFSPSSEEEYEIVKKIMQRFTNIVPQKAKKIWP